MDAIFQNVWEMSLFVIPVIMVLALCSDLLGKRYGARWKYLVWLVVAIRLCVPIQIDPPAPMAKIQVEVPNVAVQMQEMRSGQGEFTIEKTQPAPVETIIEAPDRQSPPMLAEAEHSMAEILIDFFLNYPDMLWFVGVVLFLAWQGWKYFSFKRMLKRNRRKVLDAAVLDTYYTLCRKMGVEKRPEIYFCEPLPSPLCVGFWKQEIYINSEEREENDIRLILKHELTHCKRKDLWFKGILMLARALHFFNPFVHWMAKLAEKDMELSCDVAVMENCDMEERQAYSMAILRTVKEANSKNMQMSTAFSGGKEELKARFENIFDMTKKKRGIALFTAAAVLVCGGTAFVGCATPAPDVEIMETKVVYGGYTERIVHDLYEAKLDYIGDASGVGKIFGLLPLPDGVTPNEEGMELFTDEGEPYGAMRHLNLIYTGETAFADVSQESFLDGRWLRIHGMIFLALVDNADYMKYAIHLEEMGEGYVTIPFDREMAKTYFGEKDLREFAADEETFLNFVSAINRYFYEGITKPEQILQLSELDAEAAQARMNDMLYGEEKAEVTYESDQSMLYQMIHADSLLYHIANEQGLTSSNPLEYINCAEYEELVDIGEPTLREFLSSFGEGCVGDNLEGYIMMFACQDILGEPRQADVTPTEWYQLYSALDSTLAVAFRYDEKVYPAELVREYIMGDVDEWSVLKAREDDRVRAVYDALENKYNVKGILLGHTVNIYAPYIHKIYEKGDTMQVFATIMEQTYALSRTNTGYGFFERGGSVIPSRLDFKKQNGKWVLTDWIEAEDGSYYDDSIKEMCKGHIGLASKMMDGGENAYLLLWQNIIYYMQAHYGGMDIPVYFTSYLGGADIAKINHYIKAIPMFE